MQSRDLVDSIRIPTLPASVLKVRELLSRDDVGTADVAKALAHDPPLAAQVLRIANSAQYAAREAKTSIQGATAVLGMRAVASIVLRAGVLSLYDNLQDTPTFSVSDIWRHSILTAHTADELSKHLRRRSADFLPHDHYTCGLLHDIGRIVMYDNFGTAYVDLLGNRPPEQSELQAEASGLMGVDHAEMGAIAASTWQLPVPIPDLIRYHHSGTPKKGISDIVSVIQCADRIADLLATFPDLDAGTLALKIEFPAPGLKPQVSTDLVQSVRAHFASIEL